MNLLEFATETVSEMKSIAGKDFAKILYPTKGNLLSPVSWGIDYIVRTWD